jgi:hypothetical protein
MSTNTEFGDYGVEIDANFYDKDFDEAFPNKIREMYEEDYADDSDYDSQIAYDY